FTVYKTSDGVAKRSSGCSIAASLVVRGHRQLMRRDAQFTLCRYKAVVVCRKVVQVHRNRVRTSRYRTRRIGCCRKQRFAAYHTSSDERRVGRDGESKRWLVRTIAADLV